MVKEFKTFSKTMGIIISYFLISFIAGAFLFSENSWYAIIIEFIYLFLIIAFFFKDLKKEFKIFISKLDYNVTIAIRCWMVGIILMVSSNLVLNYFVQKTQSVNETTLRELIDVIPYAMVISIIILAPLLEELIFRKAFRNIFKTNWLFFIMSTLTFAAIHVVNSFSSWLDLLLIIPYAFVGGAITFSYLKTKTVFSAILVHLIHNVITFGLYLFSTWL